MCYITILSSYEPLITKHLGSRQIFDLGLYELHYWAYFAFDSHFSKTTNITSINTASRLATADMKIYRPSLKLLHISKFIEFIFMMSNLYEFIRINLNFLNFLEIN